MKFKFSYNSLDMEVEVTGTVTSVEVHKNIECVGGRNKKCDALPSE